MTAPTLALPVPADASTRAGAPGNDAARRGAPSRPHDGPGFHSALEHATAASRRRASDPQGTSDHVGAHAAAGDDDRIGPGTHQHVRTPGADDGDAPSDPTSEQGPPAVPAVPAVPTTAAVATAAPTLAASDAGLPDATSRTDAAITGSAPAADPPSHAHAETTTGPAAAASTTDAAGTTIAMTAVAATPAGRVAHVPGPRTTPAPPAGSAPVAETRPSWASAPAPTAGPAPTADTTTGTAPGDGSPTQSEQSATPAGPMPGGTDRVTKHQSHEGIPGAAEREGTEIAPAVSTDSTTTTAPVAAPPTARTPAAAAVAATPAALPAALAETVGAQLQGLHRGTDGAHHAVLVIDAAGLGQVRIELRTQGTTVDLVLRGGHAAATDALRDALPDLRRALTDSGLVAGSTDVTGAGIDLASTWGGDGATGEAARERRTATSRGPRTLDVAPTPTPVPVRTRTTAVDLIA